MSTTYRTVSWNPQKRRYDAIAAAAMTACLATFVGIEAYARPELTVETLLIRALGFTALLMLHVILCIGPLTRLDRRFLPLLYNRRHLGVMMFTLALAHGAFAVVQFHAFGTLNPLVSVLVSGGFQLFGLGALLILFVMAATSHDFWLHNLTAPVWKTLHMGVYVAYMLIVLHVMFGVLQEETAPALAWLLGIGVLVVLGLHAAAAYREIARDREPTLAGIGSASGNASASASAGASASADAHADGFVDVCGVDEIPERRAVITCLSGERVAIFRYDGKVSALSNVCQHQNGPLGEGRIVRDCVVCPWHGYEYLPDSGASPAPFTEKVPTFHVRLAAGRVLVHPTPNPPGTRVEPAILAGESR
jgi:sulfoxide reductase heme-binding subunit YedZ